MATVHLFGVFLVVVGALMAALHRPLGLLQEKSRPRWLRLGRGSLKASRLLILLIGVAILISGIVDLADGLR